MTHKHKWQFKDGITVEKIILKMFKNEILYNKKNLPKRIKIICDCGKTKIVELK